MDFETENPTGSVQNSGSSRTFLFTWGRLEILEKIGEGAFGDVYRAYETFLQNEVALKLRKPLEGEEPESAERFLSEARRLARVRHANVVVVHGADIHGGRIGLWTELIRGRTLEQCLDDSGPMGAREATLIGIDLCRALAAVHAANLVHRDLKTTNVMRESGGRIVLMDFGSVGDLPKAGDLLMTRYLHGTPAFMAPEQLRGEIAGPPTDIYALGVLLYRLVTKELPISAATFEELSEKHLRQERVPLRSRRPDLPTDFVRIVERAMAPLPENRYAAAGDMELALAETLSPRRTSRALLGASVAAALVLVAGALLWRGWERPQPPQPDRQQRAEVGRGSLTANAALYRRASPADEPLVPGAKIAPGDRLYLALEGPESMYVYVLNEDAVGNVYVLFPLNTTSPGNPLMPGIRHHLPGEAADSLYYWTVTNAGERESILAIASREPLNQIEEEIKRVPRATPGGPQSYIKMSPVSVKRLRGLGGVASEPRTSSERGASLSEALRVLTQSQGQTGGLWLWQTQLENPTQ